MLNLRKKNRRITVPTWFSTGRIVHFRARKFPRQKAVVLRPILRHRSASFQALRRHVITFPSPSNNVRRAFVTVIVECDTFSLPRHFSLSLSLCNDAKIRNAAYDVQRWKREVMQNDGITANANQSDRVIFDRRPHGGNVLQGVTQCRPVKLHEALPMSGTHACTSPAYRAPIGYFRATASRTYVMYVAIHCLAVTSAIFLRHNNSCRNYSVLVRFVI